MQESRLFRIIYHLIENKQSTAKKLAEKFEVSVRTIYRDIDVISSVGIPIYAIQGKNGGITIDKTFTLDKSMLSQEEKESILNALQSLSATNNKHSNELLTKLSAFFQVQTTNWVEVDFSDWVHGQPSQIVFNDIKTAILERNILTFTYFNQQETKTFRSIHPLKLIFKSKAWYVYGFCLLRKDYRFFKLTRIEQLKITQEHFLPLEKTPNIETIITQEDLITVTLKFDKRMAFRVYDEFSNDSIVERNEFLFVTTSLPNNDKLYSYILSFGEYVEILEPNQIRENLYHQIKNMQKKYRT